MLDKIKNKIYSHRGKIAFCFGAGVAGYFVYSIIGKDLKTSHDIIDKLADALSDTDSYAKIKAEEEVNSILDDVMTEIYIMDESPENLASKVLIKVIDECRVDVSCYKDKIVDETRRLSFLSKLNDTEFLIDYAYDILDKIPDGTYGGVTVTHF